MQLRTDWEGFIAELRNRWPNGATVYLARDGQFTLLTALDPSDKTIFSARVSDTLESLSAQLQGMGHDCRNGIWTTQSGATMLEDLHIAAVAYKSDEKKPGLWVDCFPYLPTQSEVISKILEEFNADGTLETTDNDLFANIAVPNVVILTPAEIQQFIGKNHLSVDESD
ncbi:MAG: hypothetical protein KF824_12300 [Fimbriimonadaceae bacterium]|nr:MAG: hypothetical protein KF824_12300 [Fimbriimonadaceae bacterium]